MAESVFIAAGHTGLRLLSRDGLVWKDEQTGKEGEVWRAASFGKSLCVLVGTHGGNNIFAASGDGKTWKTSTKDGKYSLYVRGLCFGKDTFLAIGGDPGAVGSSRPFTLESRDGVAWGDFHEIGGKHILRRVAYGKGIFAGVGDRGRRAISSDGKTWKDAAGVKAIDTLVDIAFGPLGSEGKGGLPKRWAYRR